MAKTSFVSRWRPCAREAKGEPQYRAQFSDWNLLPEITDSMFAFSPPEATEKIAFLPQLRAVADPRKEARVEVRSP